MTELNTLTSQNPHVLKIHAALSPRWQYTGGWITAKVLDDGKRVLLRGYTDPTPEEAVQLIQKVQTALGWEPAIYWNCLSKSDEIPLQISETSELPIHQQVIQLLDRTVWLAIAVSQLIKQVALAVWNTDWLSILYPAIAKASKEQSKAVVIELQRCYPQAEPKQIASKLIYRQFVSLLKQSGVSLTFENRDTGLLRKLIRDLEASEVVFDFKDVTCMLVEVCYQIAVVYELDEDQAAQRVEMLAIFALAFGAKEVVWQSLGTLKIFTRGECANRAIDFLSAVTSLLAVGYAARQVYEFKAQCRNPVQSQETYSLVKQSVQAYLPQLCSEEFLVDELFQQEVPA